MEERSEMKPILFSTSMVKAILEDQKTMTRRVIQELKGAPDNVVCDKVGSVFEFYEPIVHPIATRENLICLKPKYQVHDILWVRETFLPYKNVFYYEADGNHIELEKGNIKFKWRPSIFMPHEAARIFLEITNIRAERLNIISEEDSAQEGVVYGEGQRRWTARSAFMDLWDSLNAKRGYSWENNPWVWVFEFKKV